MGNKNLFVTSRINDLIKDKKERLSDHFEQCLKTISRNLSELGNIGEPFISQAIDHHNIINILTEAKREIEKIESKNDTTPDN